MRHLSTRLILALIGTALLGFVFHNVAAVGANTLSSNGRWKSTKPELRRGVIGAHAFFHGTQALSGERLNLNEWLGHQEVLTLRTDLTPSVVEFDIHLNRAGYGDLIVGYGAEGYRGVRISADSDRQEFIESFGFRANLDGVFTERQLLERRGWPARGSAHRVRVELPVGDGPAIVKVNGDRAGEIPPGPRTGRVGFRGSGLGQTWIDNVLVEMDGGNSFREDFSGRVSLWPAISGSAAAILIGMLVLRFRNHGFREQCFGIIVLIAVGMIIGSIVWVGLSIRSKLYPADTATKRAEEEARMNESMRYYLLEAEKRFSAPPAAGEHRVLLMGSSQTFGAGARSFEETLWGYLQKTLSERAPVGKTYPVLNGAVSGGRSESIRSRLPDWLEFQPDVLVINLAFNDAQPAAGALLPSPETISAYKENIGTMIDLAEEVGASVILVGEPTDPEFNWSVGRDFGTPSAATRAALKEVAESRGLPFVDAQSYFREHVNDGHFWWDMVHLSSHGQAILSDLIAPAVLEALGARAD